MLTAGARDTGSNARGVQKTWVTLARTPRSACAPHGPAVPEREKARALRAATPSPGPCAFSARCLSPQCVRPGVRQ